MCSPASEVDDRALSALAAERPTLDAAGPRLARAAHAARLSALKARPIERTSRSAAVAFIGVGEVSDGIRLGVPAAGLNALGRPAMFARNLAALELERFDTLVFARPQISTTALRDIQLARGLGKRVVIDLDDDFYAIPPDHPGYRGVGPGNPARLQALEAALGLADLVVVATPALAERYRPLARRVEVIANGWSLTNPLWEQASPARETFNLGWAGTPTHRADVALIVNDVVAFVHNTPRAHLVIGGDPGVWHLFAELPEARRSFTPMMPFDMYPSLLAHFDVLLAPLCDNAFNNAKSDIKLLEAGIRRIPWVASPRAAYTEWGAGGLFAESTGAWETALTRLAHDPALAGRLGCEGRELADQREAAHIARRWLNVLS